MCSQECKVQRIPQDWTLLQGMSILEERQERSQFSPGNIQAEQDTYIDENGIRQPNPPMVNMLKMLTILIPPVDHRKNT